MGLLRDFLRLSLARLIALAAGALASLILARRMSPHDYALYQYAARSVTLYANFIVYPFVYWAYRYAAQGTRGALRAYARLAPLLLASSYTISLAAMLAVEPGIHLAITIAGCATLLAFNASSINVIIGVDAKLASLTMMARSVVYSFLIMLLWRLHMLDIINVSIACIISSAIVITAVYRVARSNGECNGCIREWIRGLWLPVLNSLAAVIHGLDGMLLLSRGYGIVVSAFYALSLPLRLLADVFLTAFGRLEASLLGGARYEDTTRSVRLALTVAAFVIGYAVARPEQIAAIGGVKYLAYAQVVPAIALLVLAQLIAGTLTRLTSGTDASRASQPGRRLRGLIYAHVAANTGYIAALAAATMLSASPPLLLYTWIYARLAVLVTIAGVSALLLGSRIVAVYARRVFAPMLLYTAIAAVLVALTTRPGYSKSIAEHLILVATQAAPTLLLYYSALLVLDPGVRSLARRIARRLTGGAGAQSMA